MRGKQDSTRCNSGNQGMVCGVDSHASTGCDVGIELSVSCC